MKPKVSRKRNITSEQKQTGKKMKPRAGTLRGHTIRNEKGIVAADNIEIQRIIR